MKRSDAENRIGDAEMENWAKQDAKFPELALNKEGYDPEWMRRSWEEERHRDMLLKRQGAITIPRSKTQTKERIQKALTGKEKHSAIQEQSALKDNKKTKSVAKRQVKKGQIKSIKSYFIKK
jgi:hypothetical protein